MKYSVFFVIIAIFLTYSQVANSRGKSFKVEGIAQEAMGLANELSEKESQFAVEETARRKEYSETHPTCEGSKDSCYDIISSDDRKIKLVCTHGRDTGQEKEICSNGKGKWNYGCGGSLFGSYHYDMNKAAQLACDL